MRYIINRQNSKDFIAVPKHILQHMDSLTDSRLRIAMAICLMGGECTPHTLQKQLGDRYNLATLERELHYLEGAGIVTAIEEDKQKSVRAIDELDPIKPKIKPEEVMLLASTSNEMKSLVRLAQDILGKTLSGGDITILATLMFCEGMSVEMLALGIAHCTVEKNKPNIRYIEKVMRGWLANGVTDLPSAELYLEKKDAEEKLKVRVSSLLGVGHVTYAESLLIIRWYEEFGFDDRMVKEAAMFAGEKCSVRYVNGILKKWKEQGFTDIKSVRAANTGGSNVTTVKRIEVKDDVMVKRRASVPVFKGRKADG